MSHTVTELVQQIDQIRLATNVSASEKLVLIASIEDEIRTIRPQPATHVGSGKR